jgi:hypothetical protein
VRELIARAGAFRLSSRDLRHQVPLEEKWLVEIGEDRRATLGN